MPLTIWPGRPDPLGATSDGQGTNFAIYAQHASRVELCLFGYRAHGRYAPREGLRFNPNKLLIDPYTRAVSGAIDWNAPIFGYRLGSRTEDLTRDVQDSARAMPKSVVVDNQFDWGDDRPLHVPWSETIVYETHVKGISMRHPDVPEHERGTYAGLASEPII